MKSTSADWLYNICQILLAVTTMMASIRQHSLHFIL